MAAVQANLLAKGLKSGRLYSISTYLPDAVATRATFNLTGTAAAGSNTEWRVPEPIVIYDLVMTTAPTATVSDVLINGVMVPGSRFTYTQCLSAIVFRTPMSIPVQAGDFVGLMQA